MQKEKVVFYWADNFWNIAGFCCIIISDFWSHAVLQFGLDFCCIDGIVRVLDCCFFSWYEMASFPEFQRTKVVAFVLFTANLFVSTHWAIEGVFSSRVNWFVLNSRHICFVEVKLIPRFLDCMILDICMVGRSSKLSNSMWLPTQYKYRMAGYLSCFRKRYS